MKLLKNYGSILMLLGILTYALIACENDVEQALQTQNYFAVANRGSNTITYHDTENLALIGTTTLEDGTQPTYVAYSKERNKIYTGGLENGLLYEINSENFQVERTLDIGLGAFHLWINDTVDQIWVNNTDTTQKTTTVVDLNSFTVLQSLELPEELSLSDEAVQHDVIISPEGNYAYVTILDGAESSYVVQYNTTDYSIINTAEIGGDGHLGYFNNSLYSLSENNGEIIQHQPGNLSEINNILFSGSHGVTASDHFLFVADLPGGRLGIIDSDGALESVLDTNFDKTHNLAVNASGDRLLVSYSGGMQTKVELYNITSGELSLNSTVDSGTNPFGVAFIQK